MPSAPEHEQPSVNTAIEPHTVHTVVAYNGAYGGDSEVYMILHPFDLY